MEKPEFTGRVVSGKDFDSACGPMVKPRVVSGKDYFRTFMLSCGLR